MKTMTTAASTLVLAALGVTAYAADLQLPHTFQAGTPAVASEVNANFEALRQEVVRLQTNGTCAGNDADDVMVQVGSLCVDKYEASVVDAADPTTQYGSTADDYPAGCNDNGSGCTQIVARSVANAIPATHITWFQAQQACANAGKRLLTNAEWQMAASGTPDTDCNLASGAKTNTGAGAGCASTWATMDMAGNVWEWTADWVQGQVGYTDSSLPSNLSAAYGNDFSRGMRTAWEQAGSAGTSATLLPGVLLRGGGYDATDAGVYALRADFAASAATESIGFRCAR